MRFRITLASSFILIWALFSPARADVTANFDWIALKVVSASEVNLETSHMHEFSGVQALRQAFGRNRQRFRGRFVYVGAGQVFSADARLTWYSPGDRGAVFRLYYQENPVVRAAKAGDILVLAKYGEQKLLNVIVTANSPAQQELFQLFALKHIPRSGLFIEPEQQQQSFLAGMIAPGLERVMTEQLEQVARIPPETSSVPLDLKAWKNPQNKEYTVTGTVSKVKDGDSLMLGELIEVRLVGLDAPEIKQKCCVEDRVWACGQTAKDRLSAWALGKQATCKHRKKAGFGRFASICHVGKRNLNAALVEAGLAVIYYDDIFQAEENAARHTKQGIWRSEMVTPHDWRRKQRAFCER